MEDILINVVGNLARLDEDSFWFTMENRGWMHLFDDHGRRCSPKALPKTVAKLKDDPWRSLAGELRRVGGFAKDTTPFSEFLWADFLRRRACRAQAHREELHRRAGGGPAPGEKRRCRLPAGLVRRASAGLD